MTDYNTDSENKKTRRGLFDVTFGFGNRLDDYEQILSEDLEAPDWYLKYARNIVRLMLYIFLGFSISSFLFPHFYNLDDILSSNQQIAFFLCTLIGTGINELFDTVLDQESSLVWWFTHIRFWLVLITVLVLIFLIVIKTLPVLLLGY